MAIRLPGKVTAMGGFFRAVVRRLLLLAASSEESGQHMADAGVITAC
jgi:hypothetical protein